MAELPKRGNRRHGFRLLTKHVVAEGEGTAVEPGPGNPVGDQILFKSSSFETASFVHTEININLLDEARL